MIYIYPSSLNDWCDERRLDTEHGYTNLLHIFTKSLVTIFPLSLFPSSFVGPFHETADVDLSVQRAILPF